MYGLKIFKKTIETERKTLFMAFFYMEIRNFKKFIIF